MTGYSGQSKLEKRELESLQHAVDGILHWLIKDATDDLAKKLAALLINGWDGVVAVAISDAIRSLKKEKTTRAERKTVLQTLATQLGKPLENAIAAPLLDITQELYARGIKDAAKAIKPYKPKVKLAFDLVDADRIASLQKFNLYWVGNYYGEQLGGQVTDLTAQWLKDGVNRREFAQRLQAAFEVGEFNAKPATYWRGLADHIATRTHVFSSLEKMERANVSAYEFVARLDERTSTVCRHMHGRIFPLADALKVRDRLFAAKNPEEVKKITPFRKPEQILDESGRPLPNAKLPKDMRFPPLHFRCRSRIRPIFEDILVDRDGQRHDVPDVETAAEWAKAKYPQMAFDFTGADINAVNRTLEQLDTLMGKYPQVNGTLTAVRTQLIDFSAFAATTIDGKVIKLNPPFYSESFLFAEEIQKRVQAGLINPSENNVTGLITHEFAHVLDAALNLRNDVDIQALYRQFMQEADAEKLISENAKLKVEEFIAECFTEQELAATPREYPQKFKALLAQKLK